MFFYSSKAKSKNFDHSSTDGSAAACWPHTWEATREKGPAGFASGEGDEDLRRDRSDRVLDATEPVESADETVADGFLVEEVVAAAETAVGAAAEEDDGSPGGE